MLMQQCLWIIVLLVLFRVTIQGSIIILEDISGDCTPCYRKLLSGKRTAEVHVRRVVECERIEDCQRACEYEDLFICEGFNYRRPNHGSRNLCELTSLPYPRMDTHRDFVADSQCDYYKRDLNCLPNGRGHEVQPSWWSKYPPRPGQGRPEGHYPLNGRPVEPPEPRPRQYNSDPGPTNELVYRMNFAPRPLHHGESPIDVPGPIEFDRRPPLDNGGRYGSNDPYYQKHYPSAHRPIDIPYPPKRPSDTFSYDGTHPAGTGNEDFYNRNHQLDRPYLPTFPQRRVDYPHKIGTNNIGPYPTYRKDPSRDWDSYGGVYGGSYGYETNYIGPFDMPRRHPKRPPQDNPPRPYESNHFYGQFYNYGGAFGYGDNYMPTNDDHLYRGKGGSHECSVRAGAGFKLSRSVVCHTYSTSNIDQCESLCINEKSFLCLGFAYRYNVAPTDPTDNCLLSNVAYRDLNFYTDLEPDRNYDIYVMIGDTRICNSKMPPGEHPPDECFWRVRSGFGMPTDIMKKSMFVNNLGECQVECTTSAEFTCRSLAFRYEQALEEAGASYNCFLSDWPSQEINPVNMPDMDDAELYERGSFGRGCESPFPLLNTGKFNEKPPRTDEVCYTGYHRPCKLMPYAILLSIRVDSEDRCRQKCSQMRETNSIPCMSFSYKIVGDDQGENCLLSDVSIRDLRPGLDYAYDDRHVLYAWKDLDPHCVHADYPTDNDHVFGGHRFGPEQPLRPRPPSPPGYGIQMHSGRPDTFNPTHSYGHGISRPPEHDHETRPYDQDRPDPVARPYWTSLGQDDQSGYGYGLSVGQDYGPEFSYPNGLTTFQRYTVSGYPCKTGTVCERNKVAGFWSCETEGSEFGSWDYCCAPNYHCGYSKGYHYQWCYVGSSEDQWRPCNEKYYPYLPSPRPMRPEIGHHGDGIRRGYSASQDSDYLARHWPITYLHGEPPPNCTDSSASADDERGRRINDTATYARTETPRASTPQNGQRNHARKRRLGPQSARDNRARNAVARDLSEKNERDSSVTPGKPDARFAAVESRYLERAGRIERLSKPQAQPAQQELSGANASVSTVLPTSNQRAAGSVIQSSNVNAVRNGGFLFRNTSFVTAGRK